MQGAGVTSNNNRRLAVAMAVNRSDTEETQKFEIAFSAE